MFVEFASKEDAENAGKTLTGQTFAGRVVAISFLDEDNYASADFSEVFGSLCIHRTCVAASVLPIFCLWLVTTCSGNETKTCDVTRVVWPPPPP